QRGEPLQVIGRLDLAGCVAPKCRGKILGGYSAAVVRDSNPGVAAIPDLDRYPPDPDEILSQLGRSAGLAPDGPGEHRVDGVLDQLLHGIARPGDHLASGDLRDDV